MLWTFDLDSIIRDSENVYYVSYNDLHDKRKLT